MSTGSENYLDRYLVHASSPARPRLPFSEVYQSVYLLQHHPDVVNLDLDIFRNVSSTLLEAIEGGRPSYGPLLTSAISGNTNPAIHRNRLYSLLGNMETLQKTYVTPPIGLVEISNLLALYIHFDGIAIERLRYPVSTAYTQDERNVFCANLPNSDLLLSCLIASYETDTNDLSPVDAFHRRVISYAVQLVCMHLFGAYNKQTMLDLRNHALSAPKLKTEEPFDYTTKSQLTTLLSEIKDVTKNIYRRARYNTTDYKIDRMCSRLLGVLDDAAETINLSTQIALYANRERDI